MLLTDKERARYFVYFLGQIEEEAEFLDSVPGKIHVSDPLGEWHYRNKHVEYFHRHFERVSTAVLRQFEREPFEHLIIGGRVETLPQFEGRLHRYLRDRVVARWETDVNAPITEIAEKTRAEEQKFREQQARETWKSIQDNRTTRDSVGPEDVFAALWAKQVQTLLVEPEVSKPGYHRCPACGRLTLLGSPCAGCGGSTTPAPDVFDEAVHEAIEQDAHVRYWKDPALTAASSLAAFKRF